MFFPKENVPKSQSSLSHTFHFFHNSVYRENVRKCIPKHSQTVFCAQNRHAPVSDVVKMGKIGILGDHVLKNRLYNIEVLLKRVSLKITFRGDSFRAGN